LLRVRRDADAGVAHRELDFAGQRRSSASTHSDLAP
jgi:hypothetical protein